MQTDSLDRKKAGMHAASTPIHSHLTTSIPMIQSISPTPILTPKPVKRAASRLFPKFIVKYFKETLPNLLSKKREKATTSLKKKLQFCSRKVLCESLAGNKVEYLTITSKNNPENLAKRKGVVLTSRVHPGESVGSWMMKGALDFLTDPNSYEAELLR